MDFDSAEWDRDETILVVEDDEDVRATVAGILRMEGWHVIEAIDGEDALRVAEAFNGPIAAVVSDVRMPNMSGIALFDALRAWYPGIRFLLMSGYPASENVEKVGHSTRSRFLPKPFGAAQLVSALEQLLAA